MPTLHVEEWQQFLKDENGDRGDVPHISMGRTQVSFSGASARTSFDFDDKTKYVILHSDIDAYVVFGDDSVTASQSGFLLPANTFRSFGIQQGHKRVAVITKT